MKRGFLLTAGAKKAAAKRVGGPGAQKLPSQGSEPLALSEPQPVLQNVGGCNVDSQGDYLLGKAPFGNLTEEEKALPSDYELNKSRFQSVYRDFTGPKKDAGDIVTIPQPVPDDETPCQWIVNGSTKDKVFTAPGYPARVPKPCPDLIELRSTPDMGLGLFAKRDIKGGDVFLAERPLIVSPHALRTWSEGGVKSYTPQQVKQIVMLEFENTLEYAVSRLPSESQADYRALHNAHTSDGSGPLLGVMRSNAYGIGILFDGSDKNDVAGQYGAICKIGSRINHSCIPNVGYYFKLNSFSVQFYALRDVKAGEQLCYAYSAINVPRAQRQAGLAPYGFVCKCPACVNATPDTDKLRATFGLRTSLISKMVLGKHARVSEAVIQDALKLKQDMVREGLDTQSGFLELVASISLGYRKLGKLKESEEYLKLAMARRKSSKEDE